MISATLRTLTGLSRPSPRTAMLHGGRRGYVIGDLHGRMDLLEPLIQEIFADFARSRDTTNPLHNFVQASGNRGKSVSGTGTATHPHAYGPHQGRIKRIDAYEVAPDDSRPLLLFVGDYVDRGADSRKVLETVFALQDAQKEFEVILLAGNHDLAMIDFLKRPLQFYKWLSFGAATCRSYGIDVSDDWDIDNTNVEEVAQQLSDALSVDSVRRILSMPLMYVSGNLAFVHAGINPRRSLRRQNADDLLWIREPFLGWNKPLSHIVVHGHTISSVAEACPHRIGIDTGSFENGVLTCLVIEGSRKRLIASYGPKGRDVMSMDRTEGDSVKNTKRGNASASQSITVEHEELIVWGE